MMSEALGPFSLVLLAMPGVALLVALRVLYAGRDVRRVGDSFQLVISIGARVLIFGALCGAIVGLTGFFSIGLWAVAIMVLFMCASTIRQQEHRSLLWTIALAAERGIPLPDAALAFADETQGDSGVRAAVLADFLRLGMPLDEAARWARLRMSTSTRLAIRLGHSLGLFGPALKQQMLDSHSSELLLQSMLGRVYYLAGVVLFGSFVVTFMMLKIVPVFNKMFAEFGLKLPAMTQFTIELSNYLVSSHLLAATFFLYPLLIGAMFVGALYYSGALSRDLPIVAWLCRRFDSAVIMRSLALVVSRGYPLPRALRILAELYPLRRVAWRLHAVAERVEQGAPWLATLKSYKFLNASEVAVLAAAERAGNLPWALEELAESALRRQMYYLQAWYNIAFPIVLLSFGFLVAIFVISMFMPLVALIQGLT